MNKDSLLTWCILKRFSARRIWLNLYLLDFFEGRGSLCHKRIKDVLQESLLMKHSFVLSPSFCFYHAFLFDCFNRVVAFHFNEEGEENRETRPPAQNYFPAHVAWPCPITIQCWWFKLQFWRSFTKPYTLKVNRVCACLY